MNRTLFSVVLIAAITAFGFGIYFRMHSQHVNTPTVQTLQSATVLPQPRPLAEFNLTDNQNKPFTNKSLLGHWTLFFFGYTNCPHVCPMAMTVLTKAYQLMQQQGTQTPQIVLVSVDPKHDSVARLNSFVTAFNPSFQGAVGNKTDIDALTKSLGVFYKHVNQHGEDMIEHSSTILVINPQGKFAAVFTAPHKPEIIAHDFNLIQATQTQ